jgi:hypothetical protein
MGMWELKKSAPRISQSFNKTMELKNSTYLCPIEGLYYLNPQELWVKLLVIKDQKTMKAYQFNESSYPITYFLGDFAVMNDITCIYKDGCAYLGMKRKTYGELNQQLKDLTEKADAYRMYLMILQPTWKSTLASYCSFL